MAKRKPLGTIPIEIRQQGRFVEQRPSEEYVPFKEDSGDNFYYYMKGTDIIKVPSIWYNETALQRCNSIKYLIDSAKARVGIQTESLKTASREPKSKYSFWTPYESAQYDLEKSMEQVQRLEQLLKKASEHASMNPNGIPVC